MEKGSRSLKPPRFSYESPATVNEVVELLSSHGSRSKVLAGGQSLIPLLSFRLARPDVLIGLERIPDLDHVLSEENKVTIGALVRHRSVELDEDLTSRCHMIGDAMGALGHVAIRNRGTVGGSLAHADPAAEWPAVALALDGVISVLGPNGTRSIPAEEFFEGYMSTALEPDELVTELRLSLPPPGAGSSLQEMALRHGDFAQAGAGVVLTASNGKIETARVTLLGVGPTPLRARHVENALVGETPDQLIFERVSKLAHDVMQPLGDVHADAEYKRHIGTVMIRRALERAHGRMSSVM